MLSAEIHKESEAVFRTVRGHLDIASLSDAGIAWILMECFAFASHYPSCLVASLLTTKELPDTRLYLELKHSLDEARRLVVLYKESLTAHQIDLENHRAYSDTTDFLDRMRKLTGQDSLFVFGAFYGFASASEFSRNRFADLCEELSRRKKPSLGRPALEEPQARSKSFATISDSITSDPDRLLIYQGVRAAFSNVENWWLSLVQGAGYR